MSANSFAPLSSFLCERRLSLGTVRTRTAAIPWQTSPRPGWPPPRAASPPSAWAGTIGPRERPRDEALRPGRSRSMAHGPARGASESFGMAFLAVRTATRAAAIRIPATCSLASGASHFEREARLRGPNDPGVEASWRPFSDEFGLGQWATQCDAALPSLPSMVVDSKNQYTQRRHTPDCTKT